MWQGKVGGTFTLESILDNSVGEKGKRRERKRKEKKRKKKKRKRKKRGVRSSTFSLGFMDIGPSVFIGSRGKVQLCDKSFVWVQESGFFAKLREVEVFLPLWLVLV